MDEVIFLYERSAFITQPRITRRHPVREVDVVIVTHVHASFFLTQHHPPSHFAFGLLGLVSVFNLESFSTSLYDADSFRECGQPFGVIPFTLRLSDG